MINREIEKKTKLVAHVPPAQSLAAPQESSTQAEIINPLERKAPAAAALFPGGISTASHAGPLLPLPHGHITPLLLFNAQFLLGSSRV